MKRFALFVAVCILAAGGAVGVQAWHWRERKLAQDQRNSERSAAENTAAGRLGLKTQALPPHPLDRRLALDDAMRLEPDRRFLLAARELAEADVTARFSDGRWILSAGKREFARVPELPDFSDLMSALAPLGRQWVAAAKVAGKAPRIRAVRGHKEAFAALREEQLRWWRGDRAAAVLHDAASAAASLMLQLPRTSDADDRLDAHAIALSVADAAAGADVHGQQAVLALALGYAGAARALAPAEQEPALHAFATLDRRKLLDAARRKDANAGERHLLLRWLIQDGNEQALLRFIGALRDNEHVSVPAVGQLLLHPDLQVLAAASDALPALAIAELESVRTTAPTDVDLLRALMDARNSALQTLGNNEDPRARLAADLGQADATHDCALWRGADTSAWYAAAAAAALLGSARSGYVLRGDASGLADELGTWPVPVAADLRRWLKARIAVDGGRIEEAYETLSSAKLPGPQAAADLLAATVKQSELPDPRVTDALRLALRHFDSRPRSRLIWADVLRMAARDLDRSGRLVASVVEGAPGAYPLDEIALARLRGTAEALEQLALDEKIPFPARLEAAAALADRGTKAQAERALRRLGRERPSDVETHERLIRLLQEAGRPADALAVALDLVRRFGEDDSFHVASARCAAGRQLEAMGKHEEALAMVERALPTETVCAYRTATVELARLGRKDDAENLLLAHLARHPLAGTAVTVAEVRWRSRDDAGAADILAHAPAALSRGDFREAGKRFADVFQGRPVAESKRAVEALLQAGIQPDSLLEFLPPLAKAGAAAQAFEVAALLIQKISAGKRPTVLLAAWSALRTVKGAPAAESWLRKQAGVEPSPGDDQLATTAYGEGLDEALWELFPGTPGDPVLAEHLVLLRATSIVRRGERSARRDALLKELSDPLAPWKARLARYLGLAGAHESWETQLARYVLGAGSEEEIADAATEGSRPCEAPYYFGVRAAAESRLGDAAAWYRVALECRNPAQPELLWADREASRLEQQRPAPAKLPQAAR
jgi:hypothetical protein